MIHPAPPTGNDPTASWLARLLDCVKRQKILPGRGYRVREYPSGTILEILDQAGGTGSAGLQIKRFALVSCPGAIDGAGNVTNGDYIVCRPPGGLGDGTQDVNVAKPYKWRLSLKGVTEMSVNYTFTYQATSDPNNPQRTKAASSQVNEIEMIIPLWTPMTGTDTSTGDQIIAIGDFDTGVTDSNGKKITMQAIGDSRQWAKLPPSS